MLPDTTSPHRILKGYEFFISNPHCILKRFVKSIGFYNAIKYNIDGNNIFLIYQIITSFGN